MVNEEQFARFDQLVGQEKRQSLASKTVAIFGLGGVGGAAVLALARAGIGTFYLFDFDEIELSNINRQLLAFHSTVGKAKVETMQNLILDINPATNIYGFNLFIDEAWLTNANFSSFDYVVDAIDTLKSKIALIVKSKNTDTPIISAMGAGNRLDPSMLRIMDIFTTKDDPFAKIVRTQCRKNNIAQLTVATSLEKPRDVHQRTPASSPFVPPAMGLLIASYIVTDLLKEETK
jgi:tRNA A37 threonylcarbamoyladenosine dehydratase